METRTAKKRGLAAIFALCPAAFVLALSGAGLISLFFALRHRQDLMRRLSLGVVQPLHHRLAKLSAALPFSLAEWLYALVIVGALVYIIFELLQLRRPGRSARLWRLVVRLTALGLDVYALFCLLWGVYYYGDDFLARSGLSVGAVSAEELELVTLYFAERVNAWSDLVPRDASGLCRTDRQAALSRSSGIFARAALRFPCLDGPEVPVKGMFFSRFMSAIDFTGFFCPFTAEANVNMDFPEALFAATVAHELSHQRGVAKEQEANFAAVLASLESGDADFCYSACLLAYVHLSSALGEADPAAQQMIWEGLCPEVKADLQANRDYWARFDTPVQAVADTVYEGFLQSYGQTLGMRSYGACVDLLVGYYGDAARARFSAAETGGVMISENRCEKTLDKF